MRKILRTNKHLLCIILSCAMLFSGAYAYEFTGTATDAGIEISYDLPKGTYGTLVYVFDTKVEADTVIDEELMQEHLIYAGTDTDISIALGEDAPYGAYSVIIGSPKAGSRQNRTKYILRADPDVIKEALGLVLGATDVDAVAKYLKEYNNKAYILNLDEIDDAKYFVLELAEINSLEIETATSADVESVYAEALEYATVKKGDKTKVAALVTDKADFFELDSEDIKVYEGLVTDKMIENKSLIDSLSMLKSVAQDSLALAVLNGAVTSKTIDAIEKYNYIFNATIPEFKNEEIRIEVEKVLEYTDFTDTAMVDSVLQDAYKKAKANYEEALEETEEVKPSRRPDGVGGFYAPSTAIQTPNIIENQSVTTVFADIAGYDWATSAIDYLFKEGIISGDGSGNFYPQNLVTREELVKMIIEAFGNGKIEEKDINFADVADDAWYKPYVATAYNLGIVTGESEQSFGVGKPVTRQDAAVMLLRAADAYYMTFAKKQTLVNFTDFENVSDYARIAVDALARAQIITGYTDGSFRPVNSMTRAEIVKVIYGCISVK